MIRYIKRWLHRFEIFWPLVKNYYSFDFVETIPNTISTYVIDFWEKGQMDLVSYEDEHWGKWYNRFYSCYIWFKWMKPMYFEFGDKMLKEAYERTYDWDHFSPCKDDPILSEYIRHLNAEEEEKSKWHTKMEEFIYHTDTHYIKEIAELYHGMWT